MSKLGIFFLLSWLTGNPILAILVVLFIIYILDRSFVGIFPSLRKPFKRLSQISKLRQQVAMSPHDVSSRRELARLLMERKKYQEAYDIFLGVEQALANSADYWSDRGISALKLGLITEGRRDISQALAMNERVKYGEPYLQLALTLAPSEPELALKYAAKYSEINSSSIEAYYLLGKLYKDMGHNEKAKQAWTEGAGIYRALPKYQKRKERKWALRCNFAKMAG